MFGFICHQQLFPKVVEVCGSYSNAIIGDFEKVFLLRNLYNLKIYFPALSSKFNGIVKETDQNLHQSILVRLDLKRLLYILSYVQINGFFFTCFKVKAFNLSYNVQKTELLHVVCKSSCIKSSIVKDVINLVHQQLILIHG